MNAGEKGLKNALLFIPLHYLYLNNTYTTTIYI